jgi:hypothetical protein
LAARSQAAQVIAASAGRARCCERRLPGLGLTHFRALGASVEAQLELYADGVEARAFANAVIAAAIVEPKVSASDVEGWSERTRAIARVATVEGTRLPGGLRALDWEGMTGDERLREAMRERRDELQASLPASIAALRAAMARNFALPKMLHSNVIDMTLRRHRSGDPKRAEGARRGKLSSSSKGRSRLPAPRFH